MDVFSFGCLILHVLTDQIPVPIDQYAPKSNNPQSFIKDLEWHRRASYVKQILGNELIPLAIDYKRCLKDDPLLRCNMNEVMEEILHHNRRDISHGLKGDKDIIILEQN